MKMMNIRKKLVTLAVASAVSGVAMMAAPAHAMNVSQDNLGEVLLFPYYTVKNGFDTLLTVTNTSNRTAVYKIRFREALNSREVRDFNVVLSPFDHWGAVVTATTDGALIRTFDKTCTSPQLPTSATVTGAREVAFTNSLFTGALTDGASQDMSRVKEGYFEVILMGVSTRDTSNSTNTLEYNAKHVSGTPRDCAKVDNMFLPAGVATLNGYMLPPENILKGHVTYINVSNGQAIDAEPTALENFRDIGTIVAEPGGQSPSLADGDFIGTANSLENGVVVSAGYFGSANGVSELLRASSVINEFATGAGASTSWVMTFPTKHHFTDAYISGTGPTTANGVAGSGFSEWFYNNPPTTGDGKACDNIGLNIYNREEGTVQNLGNTNFSPAPTTQFVELCYETNVVDFNGSSVFGSGTNRLGVSTTAVGTAGWAQLSFTETGTFGGLPVIGFAATVRDAGGATVNYGSSTEHAYKR